MSSPEQPHRTGTGQRGLFASVQDEISQMVTQELRLLERRMSLSSQERNEVSLVLHRLAVRLALPTLAIQGRSAHTALDLFTPLRGAGQDSA